MRWYRKLYIGETARKDRYRIVGKVKHRRPQRDAYLITLATNEKNLLDIYPANTMLWHYFYKSSILIVYQDTGSFNVRSYIEEHDGKN